MGRALRDQNRVTVAGGVSSTDSTIWLPFQVDPITGRVLVDSSTSINVETPAGTVNGVNRTFTVTNTPTCVVIDNMLYFGSGDGYTYVGGTITCNGDRPPVSMIKSLY